MHKSWIKLKDEHLAIPEDDLLSLNINCGKVNSVLTKFTLFLSTYLRPHTVQFYIQLTCDGSRSKIFSRVGSIFCGSGRVSHLWLGFGFGKLPLKTSNFSIFFPFDQKNLFGSGQKVPGVKGGLASYLLRVKSKLGAGQGPSLQLTCLRPAPLTLFGLACSQSDALTPLE